MKTINKAGPRNHGPSGEPISADKLYPWRSLHDQLGWSNRVLADARKRGLRVLKFGNRQYVTGKAVIAFLESVGSDGGAESC